MKGFPKHLNSKYDYEYVRKNFPREEWEPLFQGLLEEKKAWFCTKKLDNDELGYKDDQRKVVECENTDGAKERYQYELLDNPNSTMILLGYTESEIRGFL